MYPSIQLHAFTYRQLIFCIKREFIAPVPAGDLVGQRVLRSIVVLGIIILGHKKMVHIVGAETDVIPHIRAIVKLHPVAEIMNGGTITLLFHDGSLRSFNIP